MHEDKTAWSPCPYKHEPHPGTPSTERPQGVPNTGLSLAKKPVMVSRCPWVPMCSQTFNNKTQSKEIDLLPIQQRDEDWRFASAMTWRTRTNKCYPTRGQYNRPQSCSEPSVLRFRWQFSQHHRKQTADSKDPQLSLRLAPWDTIIIARGWGWRWRRW